MKFFITESQTVDIDTILKKYVHHHNNAEAMTKEFVNDTMKEVKNLFSGKSIKTLKKDGKVIATYVCMQKPTMQTVFHDATKNKFVKSTYNDFIKKHNIKP